MKQLYVHVNEPGNGYMYTYFLDTEPSGRKVSSVNKVFRDGKNVCAWVSVEGEASEYRTFAQGMVDDPEYAS